MTEKRIARLMLVGIETELKKVCENVAESCFIENDYNKLRNLLDEYKEAKETWEKVRLNKE